MKCRTAALLLLSCFGYLFSLAQDPVQLWNTEKKFGAINSKGEVVIPFVYDLILPFTGGLAVVIKDKKYGLVDKTGKLVLPVSYDNLYNCENDGWPKAVSVNGKWGAVNRKKQLVIPPSYPFMGCFYKGLAIVRDPKGVTYSLIDSTGKLIIPFGIYEVLDAEFNDGLAIAKRDGKWGYINKKGQEVLPCVYLQAEAFKNGIAQVTEAYEEFYINTKGERVHSSKEELKAKYENLYGLYDGLMKAYSKQTGWCYIDTTGRVIVPASQYTGHENFSEGIAFVKKDGKWGGIDKTGKTVIPFQYTQAVRPYQSGLALVLNTEGGLVAINKKGEAVFGQQIVIDAKKGATDFAYGESLFNSRKYKEALPLLQSAAANGHAEAMYLLGQMYAKGFAVPQDFNEAKNWLTKASANGSYNAKEELKKIEKAGLPQVDEYKKGYDAFNQKKFTESVNWFTKSAAKGNIEAMFGLGLIYQYGGGTEIPVNEKVAAGWYTKAADKGHIRAMNNLGELYFTKEGMHDYKLALEWLTKAANVGFPNAMYNVGVIYDEGLGVAIQKEEAYKWFKKAADKGMDEAKEAVKKIEKKGLISTEIKNGDAAFDKKEYDKALTWYQQGADKGYTEAMYKLGLIYELKHKTTLAREWYKKAIAGGHQKAKEALEDLELTGF